MNSRFKFLSSVDPTHVPNKPTKSRFNKFTLSKPTSVQVPQQKITKEPEKIPDKQSIPASTENITPRKQNILLRESTMSQIIEDNSEQMTDDDTEYMGSDDSDYEEGNARGLKKGNDESGISQVDEMGSQLQNINISGKKQQIITGQMAQHINRLSQQFTQMELLQGVNEEENDNSVIDIKDASTKSLLLETSITSLCDTASHITVTSEKYSNELRNERIVKNTSFVSHSSSEPIPLIELSDSESESNYSNKGCQQAHNKEEYFYNVTPSQPRPIIDTLIMSKVNQFFDNVPERNEIIGVTTQRKECTHNLDETIYISETSEEPEANNSEASVAFESPIKPKHSEILTEDEESIEETDRNKEQGRTFADEDYISAEGAPLQSVKQTDEPIAKVDEESPDIFAAPLQSDNDKRKPTGISTATAGNGEHLIKFKSAHVEKVSISAEININIQISALDSSSSVDSDASGSEQSKILENSKGEANPTRQDTSNDSEDTPTSEYMTPQKYLLNNGANKFPALTDKPTHSRVTHLKQFEFVPPKSLTKSKKPASTNVDNANENDDDSDKFEIDENIPVPATDQKLLQQIYGAAWKTPEIIRTYSAVKANKLITDTRATQSAGAKRISKGFNLFRRNIAPNLNSTRVSDDYEIPPIARASPPKATHKDKAVESPYFARNATDQNKKQACGSPSRKLENRDELVSNTEPAKKLTRNRKPVKYNKYIDEMDESDVEEVEEEEVDEHDEWNCESSSNAMSDSDSSDNFRKPPARLTRQTRKGAAKTSPTSKPMKQTARSKCPKECRKLVYLDLTCGEVTEVDENHKPNNVSEEYLTEIMDKFLQQDDKNECTKSKTTRRKLFNPTCFDTDYDEPQSSSRNNRLASSKNIQDKDEVILTVPIPSFLSHLHSETKNITPSYHNKRLGELITPNSKKNIQEKTPSILSPNNQNKRLGDLVTPKITAALNNRNWLTDIKKRAINKPITDDLAALSTPGRCYGFLQSLNACVSKNLCHPDALVYRNNFKANKEELSDLLYNMFNEKVFDGKLCAPITWSKKLFTTAGRAVCKNHQRGNRYATIELSEKVLTSADRLRCTLIHEMCHAAVFLIDGIANEQHGTHWKTWAAKANTVFPELPKITVCHDYKIDYKYTYQCNVCQSKSYSHSKSKKVENIRCTICHGTISIYLNKKDKDGNLVATPARKPTGFAVFVKEKYSQFRTTGVTHGEVMKLISKAFASLSVEEKKKY